MRRRTFMFGLAGAAAATPARLGTIAYTRPDGLWIRSLPGGTPARLVAGSKVEAPRFSPSGLWIAYLRQESLHVVSVDGRRNRVLGEVGQPGCQWRPDRDELLVSGKAGLRFFTPANGWSQAVREIKGAGLPALFSPDGREMVYADVVEPVRAGRLWRLSLDAAGREPRLLVSKDHAGLIPCAWSGGHILFWEDPDFSASVMADGLELYRIPAAGGSPQPMGLTTPVHSDMVALSPNGDRLAVVAGGGRNQWEEKRVAVLDVGAGAVSYSTERSMAASSPAWSPAGDRIAFSAAPAPGSRDRVGGGEPARRLLAKRRIWIADVSGKTQLTREDHYRDEEPMWSADGTHILFCRLDDHNRQTLWLMGADAANPVQVAGMGDGSWFGYYGYIDWRNTLDWFAGQVVNPDR